MSNRDELIFWFDQPPKISLGAFNYVAKEWGNKVLYIADHDFGAHRKMIKWDNADYGNAEMIILSTLENPEEYIKGVFEKYPNAVHIMNGFYSSIGAKINPYIKKEGVKLAVHTEKPLGSRRGFTFEKWLRNLVTPIKYKKNYNEYKDWVDVVIPLGVWGKQLFESYGWSKEKVFSFMYCTPLQPVEDVADRNDGKVKILFVGRLNYKARGLDVLMKAFDKLPETDNWSLDIVGGYGEKKDDVKAWADSKKNVSFLGPWPADEVGKRMTEYDVYVTTSKADGWQAQINEALNAGISVICTDETVSDEMVTASGAGIVVRAADVKALHKALITAIDNPQLVKEWKEKAKEYRHRIKGDMVGDYLIDILDYTFYDKEERPSCPWL